MNQPDIFQDKKERADFYIALAVLTLAALFIFTHSFSLYDMEAIVDNGLEEVKTDVPRSYAFIENRRVTVLTPVVDKVVRKRKVRSLSALPVAIAPVVSQGEKKSDAKKVSELKTTLDPAVSQVPEQIKEVEGTAPISSINEAAVEEDISSPQLGKEEDVLTTDKSVLSTTQRGQSSNDCHISVGLFKESGNVSRLVERLEARGYNVYTKAFPHSTQVGVYVTCESTLAESILSEIQTMYAADAFIEELD